MSASARSNPVGSFNRVLNEVLDVVQDVRQALRKVPATEALHGELDRLFEDLRTWARLLVEEDEALGVSPLSRVSSAAGRVPPNLWTAVPSDDEVRRILAGHLDRLEERVAAALAEPPGEGARTALNTIHTALAAHRQAVRPVHP